MDCVHAKETDEYDENLSCYHKVKLCSHNNRPCQGTEGVCSRFTGVEEPVEEPAEETPEEAPEPEETPQEEPVEEPVEEQPEISEQAAD